MLAVAIAEVGQFFVDDLEVFNGVRAAGCVGYVDQVNQQAGALNVAEELGAEAGAEMGEGLLVGLLAYADYAEVGFEGSEGVVGDFGLGGGDAGDERGFAGVGVAYQAYVGQKLEFEAIGALLSGTA